MADQTNRKSNFISKVGDLSAQLLALTRDCEELAAYQTDSGFQIGGANAIVDADCVGDNAHMTAALIGSVVTVFGQLGTAMTAPRRASLRNASKLPDV